MQRVDFRDKAYWLTTREYSPGHALAEIGSEHAARILQQRIKQRVEERWGHQRETISTVAYGAFSRRVGTLLAGAAYGRQQGDQYNGGG